MNFLEGERGFTENELRDNEITRYQVTKFYQEQIRNSGYYEQLKHIVEPSLKEFYSPGDLDTSGEGSNTVVTGLQHKYAANRTTADHGSVCVLLSILFSKANRWKKFRRGCSEF